MSVLIVQLGDIHVLSKEDPIFERVSQISSCIASLATPSTDGLLFLLTGDYVQKGSEPEYDLAKNLVDEIVQKVESSVGLSSTVVTLPGNHDLDLAENQSARERLIDGFTLQDFAESSIVEGIAKPLSNYWAFAKSVEKGVENSWQPNQFFRREQLKFGKHAIQLQLINSAWMSKREEHTNSLLFPVEEIVGVDLDLNSLFLTVIHHPLNWFKMPEVKRDLQTRIETTSDLVI